MATSQGHNCDLCEAQHVTNKAEIWCPICEEALCSKCKIPHGLARITKTHKTISVDDYEKLPPLVQEIDHQCKDHNERFEYFCACHDKACCVKCLKTTHRKCHETLTPLSELLEGFKSSKVFTDLENSVKNITSNMKEVYNFEEKNLKSLEEQKDSIEIRITEKSQKMRKILDEAEQNLKGKLIDIYVNHKNRIQENMDDIKIRQSGLEVTQNNLENIKSYGSEFQAYFGIQSITENVQKEDDFIQSLVESGERNVQTTLKLQCTEEVFNSDTLLGKIEVEVKPVQIKIKSTFTSEAQISSAVGNKIQSVVLKKKTSFSLREKEITREILGYTISKDGNYIFSDHKNKCLIIADQAGNNIKTINLSSSPSGIACLDDKIIITFGYLKEVLVFQLTTETTILTIRCDAKPASVVVMNNNNIVVGMLNHGFQIFDSSGKAMSECIKTKLVGPHYFVVLNDKIFYTDWKANKVLCIDMEGKLVFEHSFKHLTAPLGIVADEIGNIYVCGFKSKSIFLLSEDGSQCKEIISESDGINNPRCLHYIPDKRLLIVVSQNGDVRVFEIVYSFSGFVYRCASLYILY